MAMFAIACGGPKKTALAYENARLHGDAAAAYALASTKDRSARSFDAFRAESSLSGILSALLKNTAVSVESVQQDGEHARVTLALTGTTIAGQQSSEEETLMLLKEADGWRVLTGWATTAALSKAAELVTNNDYRAAQAVLDAADATAGTPEDAALTKMRASVEEEAAKIVAGKWSKLILKDAMTDVEVVAVMLPAENESTATFGAARPTLMARCREKQLGMLLFGDWILRRTYRDTLQARYRFGQDKAESVLLDVTPDAKTAVIPHRQAESWMDHLAQNASSTLVIELPLYSGSETVRFKLEGASEAFALVRSACGLSAPSPSPVSAPAVIDGGAPLAAAEDLCGSGDQAACVESGVKYKEEGGAAKLARALEIFDRACTAGDARGCNELGRLYYNGTGIKRDQARAMPLFAKSCDGGRAGGCRNLAVGYLFGQGGLEINGARARALVEKACELREGSACTDLAAMYAVGQGGEKNLAQAAAFSAKGCNEGAPKGCFEAGVAYENGNGVAKDAARAVGFYVRGCDEKYAIACNNLGRLYVLGQGAPKDLIRARDLYVKACKLGERMACENLNGL